MTAGQLGRQHMQTRLQRGHLEMTGGLTGLTQSHDSGSSLPPSEEAGSVLPLAGGQTG